MVNAVDPGNFCTLYFNGHFPGGPGLASTGMSPFCILLELRVMEVVVTTGAVRRAKFQSEPTPSFLQAGYPSFCPTSSVER